MERLTTVLAILKKQHFWFMVTLATIAGLVAWWSATARLSTEFDGFTAKIDKTYTELERVKNHPQHPNQTIIDGLNAETNELRAQVKAVWEKLYADQQNTVLKWPAALKEDFLAAIEGKKFGDDIHVLRRFRYRDYVKERFRELRHIVKAKEISERPADGENLFGPGAAARRQAREVEPDYIVIWEDQDKIIRKYDWGEEAPSPLRVWVTQEELWVYEDLLAIIAETNINSTGPHNATISVINTIEVGQEAASRSGSQNRVAHVAAGDGGGEGAPAPPPPGGGEPLPQGAEGEGGGPNTGEAKTLLEGRYLGKDGKPLPATVSATNDEFKRMPVRLVVQMNPHEIPRLITACANADLPVEVDQIRINVGGVKRNSREMARLQAAIGGNNPEDTGRRQPHVEVVVHGIIYIFNPVDPKKLGYEQAERQRLQPGAGGPSSPTAAVPGAAIEGPQAGVTSPTEAPAAVSETPSAPAGPPAEAAPGAAPPPAETGAEVPAAAGQAPAPGEVRDAGAAPPSTPKVPAPAEPASGQTQP